MGLNLVTVPATPRLPLKKSNTQGTFPSTLRANVVLCELWPRPVETTIVLYPTSLPPLQPAQCPSKCGRFLCLYASRPLCGGGRHSHHMSGMIFKTH